MAGESGELKCRRGVLFCGCALLCAAAYAQAPQGGPLLSKALETLSARIEMLEEGVAGRAQSQATINFLTQLDEAYIRRNLAHDIFLANKVHFILYYDQNGELVYGKGRDFIAGAEKVVPLRLRTLLQTNETLGALLRGAGRQSGIIHLDGGPFLFAACSIAGRGRPGPGPGGALLFGAFLDDPYLAELSGAPAGRPALHAVSLSEPGRQAAPPASQAQPQAYALLNGLDGRPAFLLHLGAGRRGIAKQAGPRARMDRRSLRPAASARHRILAIAEPTRRHREAGRRIRGHS